jgi:hypothetical protein
MPGFLVAIDLITDVPRLCLKGKMINSQPPTPNIQLESMCWDSEYLEVGNWYLEVDAAGFSSAC